MVYYLGRFLEVLLFWVVLLKVYDGLSIGMVL